MAKKDRTGNRKSREQRKQFKVPELGYYLIVTDPNSYYHFADEWRGKKIREVDNEFRHPWDTVKFLTEDLHTCCIGYDGEHCEGDCERRLGWWPILTCQQAQWQIFEFRKEV